MNDSTTYSFAVASFLNVVVGFGSLAWAPATTAARPTACTVSAGVTISGSVITGTTGSDTIDCRLAKGKGQRGYTIYGMGGNDRIDGSARKDVIWGNDPATLPQSCASYDGGSEIRGHGGNDEIHGSVCGAVAEGGDGDDLLIAEGGLTGFSGGPGNDTIDLIKASEIQGVGGIVAQGRGDDGNDLLIGGAVGFIGYGGAGNDVMNGGNGDDYLVGDDGDDALNGGGGFDALDGGAGSDQLNGDDGDDALYDDSPERDFFIGGLNDTTAPPNPLVPWGDTCGDADGVGTAPAAPYGTGNIGLYGATQNDSIDGCEFMDVTPNVQ